MITGGEAVLWTLVGLLIDREEFRDYYPDVQLNDYWTFYFDGHVDYDPNVWSAEGDDGFCHSLTSVAAKNQVLLLQA